MSEFDDPALVGRGDVGDFGKVRDAGVARRGVKLSQGRRLRQLPRQRMFTAPRPDQKDVHGGSPV